MKKKFNAPTAEFVAFCYNEQIAASGAAETCTQDHGYVFWSGHYYTDGYLGCSTKPIANESQGTYIWVGNLG